MDNIKEKLVLELNKNISKIFLNFRELLERLSLSTEDFNS